jgi:hypothetical protein
MHRTRRLGSGVPGSTPVASYRVARGLPRVAATPCQPDQVVQICVPGSLTAEAQQPTWLEYETLGDETAAMRLAG